MVLADDIARLRRLINEPTETYYSDTALTDYLTRNQCIDSAGRRPYANDPNYVTTHDVYRAAAEVWDEKAALSSAEFDYSGDGSNLSLSQLHDHALKQAAFCRSRSMPRVIMPVRDGFQTVERLEEIELQSDHVGVDGVANA